MKKITKVWICHAVLKALKNACQTMVAMIGASVLLSDVNWMTVLSAGGLSILVSLLTSFSHYPEQNETKEENKKEICQPHTKREEAPKSEIVPVAEKIETYAPRHETQKAKTVFSEVYTTYERVTEYRTYTFKEGELSRTVWEDDKSTAAGRQERR